MKESDLQLTIECAKAIGLRPAPLYKPGEASLWPDKDVHKAVWIGMMMDEQGKPTPIPDPLHDDLAMLNLVKKFGLCLDYQEYSVGDPIWMVYHGNNLNVFSESPNLNRAVTEFVALLQRRGLIKDGKVQSAPAPSDNLPSGSRETVGSLCS